VSTKIKTKIKTTAGPEPTSPLEAFHPFHPTTIPPNAAMLPTPPWYPKSIPTIKQNNLKSKRNGREKRKQLA